MQGGPERGSHEPPLPATSTAAGAAAAAPAQSAAPSTRQQRAPVVPRHPLPWPRWPQRGSRRGGPRGKRPFAWDGPAGAPLRGGGGDGMAPRRSRACWGRLAEEGRAEGCATSHQKSSQGGPRRRFISGHSRHGKGTHSPHPVTVTRPPSQPRAAIAPLQRRWFRCCALPPSRPTRGGQCAPRRTSDEVFQAPPRGSRPCQPPAGRRRPRRGGGLHPQGYSYHHPRVQADCQD